MSGISTSDFYVYVLYRDTAMIVPFYIGKGRRQRMNQHSVIVAGDVSHRANTIRQVVKECGYLPRQKIAVGLTEHEALSLEIKLINETEGLINKTAGGDGWPHGFAGRRWTPEQRAKVSASLKGRKKTPEHIANVAAALRGRVVSAETRERLRLAHLGQKAWNKGISLTQQARANISRAVAGKPRPARRGVSTALKGRKQSPEHVAKRVAALRGRTVSAETRERLRLAHLGQKPWNKGLSRRK